MKGSVYPMFLTMLLWMILHVVVICFFKCMRFFSSSRFNFLLLCLCLCFVIMDMVYSLSNLVYVSVPLELMFLCGVFCGLSTIGLLVVSINHFINIVEVLLKEPYVYLIIISSRCLCVFRALVFTA